MPPAHEMRAAVRLTAAVERDLARREEEMRRHNPGPGWLKDMLSERARRVEMEHALRRRSPKKAHAYDEARAHERRAVAAAFSRGDAVGHVFDGVDGVRRIEEVLACGRVRLGPKPGSTILSELAEPEELWHAAEPVTRTRAPSRPEPLPNSPRGPVPSPTGTALGMPNAGETAQPSLFGP